MSKSAKILIILIIASLLIGGGLFAWSKRDTSKNDDVAKEPSTTNQTNTTNNNAANADQGDSTPVPSEVKITYTGTEFTPASVKVKSGGTVTVTNDSDRSLDLYSLPHPAHDGNTELNIGEVKTHNSRTFTVTKVGSWGYHNHVNPSKTGTLIVTE